MPTLKVHVNGKSSEETRREAAAELSRVGAEVIGKPERYVQVVISDGDTVLFGGQEGPSAFVEINSIGGLSPAVNKRLSERVCDCLKNRFGVSPDRVYLNFNDKDAADWGWNRSTFG